MRTVLLGATALTALLFVPPKSGARAQPPLPAGAVCPAPEAWGTMAQEEAFAAYQRFRPPAFWITLRPGEADIQGNRVTDQALLRRYFQQILRVRPGITFMLNRLDATPCAWAATVARLIQEVRACTPQTCVMTSGAGPFPPSYTPPPPPLVRRPRPAG